jgi:hypothetical protein
LAGIIIHGNYYILSLVGMSEYHKPTDTADKINVEGLGRKMTVREALLEELTNLWALEASL